MRKEISSMVVKKFINAELILPPYNPTADFEWISKHSRLPWLPLDIEIPYLDILKEIDNIKTLMSDHRDQYEESSGWKSFCIHGKSYDATREDSYYKDDRALCWTPEAQSLMPNTTHYFQHVWPATTFRRLRVMLLEPGGYIGLHKDHEESGLGPINIAITQPDHCYFVMEKHGQIPFRPGSAFWLDISNRHTVCNSSQTARWHLIVHQDYDHNFQDLVVKSYNIMYNNKNEDSHHNHTRRSQYQDRRS